MNGYKITTLCYLFDGDSVLLLYRNKKENDENQGKWIGIGGKVEPGESSLDCVRREVLEETGLTLTGCSYKGIILFRSDRYPDEYMVLYEGSGFSGRQKEDCDEGKLEWVKKEKLMNLPMWEGDRLFLEDLLAGKERIGWELCYEGDRLVSSASYREGYAFRDYLADALYSVPEGDMPERGKSDNPVFPGPS